MNNRDPFSLRRGPQATPLALLRGGADFAARSVNELHSRVEQFLEPERFSSNSSPSSSSSSPGMSTAAPRHSYALNTDQTNSTWQQRKSPNGFADGVGEKVHDFFTGRDTQGELPMYKDKPYNYNASGRKLPFWRRQKLLLLLLGAFALFVYFTGGHKEIQKVANGFTGLGEGSAKWEDRQERVREAFKLSWKAYEEHAWGKDSHSSCGGGIANM